MFSNSIGFLGGGRVTRILLGGWRRGGMDLDQVIVSDPDSTAVAKLSDEFGSAIEIAADNLRVADRAIVFLAVHPPMISQVLGEIAEHLGEQTVLVSLAPKITIEQLSRSANGFDRIARMIPNAASIVGSGYNPVAWGDALPEASRAQVRRLLQPLGQSPEVPESTLEAYAVITAMGPTYFWPQWSELVSLAETFGLPSQDASEAVQAMLQGAIATSFDSGLTADDVNDLIPVKPLAEFEPVMRETMQAKLSAVMEKIRPA